MWYKLLFRGWIRSKVVEYHNGDQRIYEVAFLKFTKCQFSLICIKGDASVHEIPVFHTWLFALWPLGVDQTIPRLILTLIQILNVTCPLKLTNVLVRTLKYLKKKNCPWKQKQKRPQKLLIIGQKLFFQYWPGCQNGPKTEIPWYAYFCVNSVHFCDLRWIKLSSAVLE